MDIQKRIRDILNENMTSVSDYGSSANNRRNNNTTIGPVDSHKMSVNEKDKGSVYRNKDKLRKRRERNRELKEKASKNGEEIEIDPREYLEGPFKLTLKETFIKNIIDYYETGKSKYAMDCVELLEEYPKLKLWVGERSRQKLPNGAFNIYAGRISKDGDEIGEPAYRSGDHPHNWYLSRATVKTYLENKYDEFYVMEAKIPPSKCIIYFAAFLKDIENLVLSGKIEEPQTNIIREIRKRNEVVVESEVDAGIIIEIIE